ncbi:glycoside hydrolase [Dokdonia pacifica]|uniref:Phosphatidylinositol alpha-1,6-mannosyltransferase n=1 Tax=Dokdonia pacifica TaxID=1627892 RepID=A0A238Z0Y0_9FLAO|nr:glycosyltransferase family 4 protein [Dokdonia pacifica]GGG08854.1 glycoside hydrolase [Dokdonia pacifica]SNR77040.1 phosphatidylinositol alpha-1,6-mannosyltransferase [Dokdonia pacifica]
MKNRNLLILSYDYPPSTGGIARLCHEITGGLSSFYNTITILTVDIPTVSIPYQTSSTVEVIRLPAKRIQCELATIRTISKIKDKQSYDVICGIWHPEALLAFLGGMKNIYILGHGAEFLAGNAMMRKHFWLPIYAKWMLGKAKKVITNSHYTKGLVAHIQPKAMVEALPLAVNHEFFTPNTSIQSTTDEVIRFVTVSRILKFKGHDFILKTLESLPQKLQSKIEWHIAGTGPYLEELKKLIMVSSIKSQIHLHGFIPDQELPDFYNTKDVFILATREEKTSNQVEGFGLVFLEAQSCGIPAIGTKTGGISDAIEVGNGGWLFEQDNVEALTHILTNIIETPELIAKQATKARERVLQRSTWEFYCKQLYKIIST